MKKTCYLLGLFCLIGTFWGLTAQADDGTEADPWRVSSLSQLTTALAKRIPSGSSANHIKLTADLVYKDPDHNKSITRNTVIDGDGHYILYNGTTYAESLFETGAGGISITFKNLNFGNATYPNGSYWGMIWTHHPNTKFTVENVNWHIQKGNQPFYGNDDNGTSLTFKGTNSFRSVGSVNGGEFVENFRTVNFADNSKTTVYTDSLQSSAMFWCGDNLKINIGKHAILDMTTSKSNLVYGSGAVRVNVDEKGKFLCKFILGTHYNDANVRLQEGGSGLTMNFGKDSIGRFTIDTGKDVFSGSSPTLNLQSPNYVIFDAIPTNKSVLQNITPKFVRKDSDGHAYPINYLKRNASNGTTSQSTLKPNASGTTNVTASNIGRGYSVAYARASKILALKRGDTVGRDVSQLDVSLDSSSLIPTDLTAGGNGVTKVHYKLANTQLFSGNDITTDAAQASIESAGTAQGVIQSNSQAITTNIEADSKTTYQNLLSQNYYTFSKLESKHVPGYTMTSPWMGGNYYIPEHIEVTLPDALIFDSPKKGEFGKAHNLGAYTAVNHGNVPVNLDVKGLTINPGSSSEIGLVDSLLGKKQLGLKLAAENTASAQNTVWGPLRDSAAVASQPIRLEPFWNAAKQADFYVKGEHSVSLLDNGPHPVSYTVRIAVDPIY
jgi:hypothetical protein